MKRRSAVLHRYTKETHIDMTLDLDGTGRSNISTTIPFLDEMLTLFAQEGRFNLKVKAYGDTQIDDHHLVEDIGIALGETLTKAVGDKRGISRFGNYVIPKDKTQSYIALDLSNRTYFVWKVVWKNSAIGTFDGLLLEHFFESIASNARMNLHMALKEGKSSQHMSETLFRGLACALHQAVTVDARVKGVPSTKGCL